MTKNPLAPGVLGSYDLTSILARQRYDAVEAIMEKHMPTDDKPTSKLEKAKTAVQVGAVVGGVAGILVFWSFVGSLLIWITAQINTIMIPVIIIVVVIGFIWSLVRR